VAYIRPVNYPLHPSRLAHGPAAFHADLDRRPFVFMKRPGLPPDATIGRGDGDTAFFIFWGGGVATNG